MYSQDNREPAHESITNSKVNTIEDQTGGEGENKVSNVYLSKCGRPTFALTQNIGTHRVVILIKNPNYIHRKEAE